MALNLFSGLAQGFVAARDKKMQQEQNEELKKLQVKLFKKQLEEQDFRQGAQSKLMEMMSGAASPVPFQDTQGQAFADVQGQPGFESFQSQPEGLKAPGKPMSLTDVLADPQGQLAAIQSGMFKPQDVMRKPNQGLEVLKALGFGGQPDATADGPSMGAGGMELTGIKIGPEGQVMPDLSRPKFKTEVPSPDGRFMIQLDEFGRPMGMRPAAASEQKPPAQTSGQTAVDQNFAKEYVEFKAAGGYTDIVKQLTQLKDASGALETEKNITGPQVGMMPESVLKTFNPRAIAVRDAVLESGQRNLRMVLGPQFTEKEGAALLGRVYDPMLPQPENKKRVDRLYKQIDDALKAKQAAADYFEEHGTLTGFKGKINWSIDDFMPEDTKPSLNLGKKDKKSDPLGIR